MHLRYKIAIILILLLICNFGIAYAQENFSISDLLNEHYNQYNFTDVDDFMSNNSDTDFSSIVTSILDGTFNSENIIWNNILKLVFPSVRKVLQNMPIMFILVLLLSILDNFIPSSSSFYGLVSNIGNCLIGTLLFVCFMDAFDQARQGINTIIDALNKVVPILSAALVASGASSTANTLSPESAVISQGCTNLINNIFLPIILVLVIILVLDVIFVQNRFSNLYSFGKNVVTWGTGGLFTIYAAIVSINGFASTSYDGISLRTVRYAMSNSVPLIGSLLGDGVNMAIACCGIVKSAIGIASFIMILFLAASPIITMASYMLMLKISAVCISPFASQNTTRLVNSMADLIKLIISILVGLTIIILIMLGFVIGAANSF